MDLVKKSLKLHFTFRMLLHGVKQFNLQPERGLKYLQENGFLESTPESVAKFLFRQERLSKKQIGWYKRLLQRNQKLTSTNNKPLRRKIPWKSS